MLYLIFPSNDQHLSGLEDKLSLSSFLKIKATSQASKFVTVQPQSHEDTKIII